MKIIMDVIKYIIIRSEILQFSLRIKFTYLIVRISLLLSDYIDTNSEYTVLCLGRPIFDEEIIELSNQSSQFNYLIIPKYVFINIFKYFFPDMPFVHNKYFKLNGFDVNKELYQDFIIKYLHELKKHVRFDAILTANYVYLWQQELAKVCKSNKVPFIVLHKEGITTKDAYVKLVDKYTNDNFIGDKMLVYNKNIAQALLNKNINGLNAGRLEVVGVPRFDRYFDVKEDGEDILFFSVYIEDKLNHLNIDKKTYNEYIIKAKEFHIAVMQFANKNPTINVIIKTKNNERYFNYVTRLRDESGYTKLKNLSVISNKNTFDLIKNAKYVIGYNSATLIEGLIAGREIVLPYFCNGIVKDFFSEYPELVRYAEGYQQLEKILSCTDKREIDEGLKNQFLEEMMYIPDGKASERAESTMLNVIQSF